LAIWDTPEKKQAPCTNCGKYFGRRNGQAWTFVGTDEVDKRGKRRELTLRRAGDVPIERHVKVKGMTANPYDPQWEVYFEKRLSGWHNHHIVWRSHGGSDTADNRSGLA
jgi:RNA-directed DNA polymerase